MDDTFREILLETINFEEPFYVRAMLAKTANLLNKFTTNTVTACLELIPALCILKEHYYKSLLTEMRAMKGL